MGCIPIEKLVTYCRQGKFEEAQVELYSKDAISIEPEDTPMAPGLTHRFESCSVHHPLYFLSRCTVYFRLEWNNLSPT
jgi:hypothetical protein